MISNFKCKSVKKLNTKCYHGLQMRRSSWHTELRNFQTRRISRTIRALHRKQVVPSVNFKFTYVNKIDFVSGETTCACSWQHYFQLPKAGKNTNAHHQVNRKTKCCICRMKRNLAAKMNVNYCYHRWPAKMLCWVKEASENQNTYSMIQSM